MADSTEITVATFEQISTRLSQLLTNYSNMASVFYDLFYSSEQKDITLQLFSADGTLTTYTIPNRAKDFRYVQNGAGSPEGAVSANIGTIYMDTTNGLLYIKQIGTGSSGWTQVGADSGLEKGSGSPEGTLIAEKGTLYVDTANNGLYLKSTDVGATGWVLISADIDNVANKDLSNLTSTGENHFTNLSLSNLNDAGNAKLNAKVNNKGDETIAGVKTFTGDPVFQGSAWNNQVATQITATSGLAGVVCKNNTSTYGAIGMNGSASAIVTSSTGTNYNLVRNSSVNTAVGSASVPVYINSNGITTAITSYSGNAATATQATNDGVGNNIANTYATKTNLNTTRTDIETEIEEAKSELGARIYLKTAYIDPDTPTNGYNIWSNGYCEQWGVVYADGTTNVTVQKKYKDLNYCVLVSPRSVYNDGNWQVGGKGGRPLAKNKFVITCDRNGSSGDTDTRYTFWKTFGYLADGEY